MQETEQVEVTKVTAKPIGGWLWVVMLILIASGLQIIIHLVSTTNELFVDEWKEYFGTTDELLKLRVNIYFYLILSGFLLNPQF